MDLEEAWLKIKGMENSDCFKPNQIYSILSDLGVFKINPRIRLVLKAALTYDLWDIILSEDVSTSKIDLLKSKLQYDGFSDDVIGIIVLSITNDIQTLTTISKGADFINSNIQGIDLTSNIPSEISFLGIKLGQPIKKCIILLEKKKFEFGGYVEIPKGEYYAWLRGKFICYNSCKVSLYYNCSSKLVYQISIFQNTGNLKERQLNELSNQIHGLYTTKFGKPISFRRSFDDIMQYKISSKEFIEIRKNQFNLPRIFYINQTMRDEAKFLINKIKVDEKATETKDQRNLIERFLNDI